MADFPTSVFSPVNPGVNSYMDDSGLELDQVISNLNNEVVAIETELGASPKTITEATSASASPSSVAVYLDMVATQLKAIIGGAHWYTSVTSSLASLATHIAATAAHGVSGALVGTTDTQTLTNKVINGSSNTLTVSKAQLTGAPSGTILGDTDTQTITNKTIDAAANTISNISPAMINNRTRSMFIEASRFIACEGSPTLAAGSLDTTPHWLLSGSASEAVTITVKTPSDWVSGTIQPILHFAMVSDTTHNVVVALRHLEYTNGDNHDAAGAGVNETVSVPNATTEMKFYTMTGANIITVTTGQNIRIAVRRIGGDASDDATTAMKFIGLELQYTADM